MSAALCLGEPSVKFFPRMAHHAWAASSHILALTPCSLQSTNAAQSGCRAADTLLSVLCPAATTRMSALEECCRWMSSLMSG